MSNVRLHENLKNGIQPECEATTTKPEYIMVNPHEETISCNKFYSNMCDYEKRLNTFEGMVMAISIINITFKLKYQGMLCMFLGYAQNHTGDI